MKGSEFKLKLPSGEEVVVMSWNRLGGCQVVGEDSILRLNKVPINSCTFPNRYRYLPERPFCDFPKRRVVAIRLKNARKNRMKVRYSIHTVNETAIIFKSLKRAISHIISLGKAFSALYIMESDGQYKILTSSGLRSFAFDMTRPPKISMKTLKREWKRIEKKISV